MKTFRSLHHSLVVARVRYRISKEGSISPESGAIRSKCLWNQPQPSADEIVNGHATLPDRTKGVLAAGCYRL